ncbi:looped-hinge helix DNA binding domain-containing protein, AbrB family [Ruminococcaceae bacterium FB2012]|nr:looped-hinge helix DNA binding domain-containing protein, AbrB family [Ruminococcaceae bacterium FB2012]
MSIDFSRLKMYRTHSGLTQEQLAEKIGVSRQAVAKWERGDAMPDLDSCIRLAELYGITVDLLVRDIGKEVHYGDGKHVFGLAKVNSKGQFTLPANCRSVFGISPGDTLLVLGDEDKGGIALVKVGGVIKTVESLLGRKKE